MIDEATVLAETIKTLNTLQLFVLVSVISNIGFIVITLFFLRGKQNEAKLESEESKRLFTMMSQIYNSFSSTTDSFKREQEKDWQRTQQFFSAFRELFRIQKQIYYVIGRLEKRIETIEGKFEVKENG